MRTDMGDIQRNSETYLDKTARMRSTEKEGNDAEHARIVCERVRLLRDISMVTGCHDKGDDAATDMAGGRSRRSVEEMIDLRCDDINVAYCCEKEPV